MIVGIVGSEEIKFTPLGRLRARLLIASILANPEVIEVVSGGCHLGGIDIWAVQLGRDLGLEIKEYPPKTLSWALGYMPRNLQIARRSDVVHCITVDKLPENYVGMRFEQCYHCKVDGHVKSGGCWTMHQAIKMGKKGQFHIIQNY